MQGSSGAGRGQVMRNLEVLAAERIFASAASASFVWASAGCHNGRGPSGVAERSSAGQTQAVADEETRERSARHPLP